MDKLKKTNKKLIVYIVSYLKGGTDKMVSFIKKLFSPSYDFRSIIANGTPIIDVRSKGEYYEEHILGAVNIPLNKIAGKAKNLKSKHVGVITCCRSGLRSLMAKKY